MQPIEIEAGLSDEDFQDRILPDVSRTFALTIPQLPPALRTAVTSAYLLCRIADTIEDEPAISPAESFVLLKRFAATITGAEAPGPLAAEVVARLSSSTLPAERLLVHEMERVLRVVNGFEERQRAALRRCIEVMCQGMHHFQQTASLRGLKTLKEMDSYCYYVAGIVGETLTELFCGYSSLIAERHTALYSLSRSFGEGLQMTNILKDVWEDRSRGACWLPQDVFGRYGIDLGQLSPERSDARFHQGIMELIGVAHRHLRNALEFTLLIPRAEAGIRRFCLWAIGLAVLTLRKIQQHPGYRSGADVKVSRSTVAMTTFLTNLTLRSNWLLTQLFEQAARGLPLVPTESPATAWVHSEGGAR